MSSESDRFDIQDLRGVAVLAVMIFHFNPAWSPGGFVGVDVFFVISGFLVFTILLNQKSCSDYSLPATLRYFYESRHKRIVSAYFVMLVVVALVASLIYVKQDFDSFKKVFEKSLWFNSNNYFAGFGDYFALDNHEQLLLHTWSLAVEMQFYLLVPFLVLMLPTQWLGRIFLALLIGLTLITEYRYFRK